MVNPAPLNHIAQQALTTKREQHTRTDKRQHINTTPELITETAAKAAAATTAELGQKAANRTIKQIRRTYPPHIANQVLQTMFGGAIPEPQRINSQIRISHQRKLKRMTEPEAAPYVKGRWSDGTARFALRYERRWVILECAVSDITVLDAATELGFKFRREFGISAKPPAGVTPEQFMRTAAIRFATPEPLTERKV